MKKKSQLRKYTVDKFKSALEQQKNSDVLQQYIEILKEKVDPLIQKKNKLIGQIEVARNKTRNLIRQMNDGFQSRIEKTQTIIMNVNSRPTREDVKNTSDLYAYMENQDTKILNNTKDIEKCLEIYTSKLDKYILNEFSYEELDMQYHLLNMKCSEQTKVKGQLQNVLQKNREFYNKIDESIQKCRQDYEIVEQKIKQRQKELDHLKTYLNLREREDSENVARENGLTDFLEAQLLKAQQIFNFTCSNDQGLSILGIEGTKSLNR